MKTTIAVLALSIALWGCGNGGDAPPADGGTGGAAPATGGSPGSGGSATGGGAGGSATGGASSGGSPGTGGAAATGGSSGAGGTGAPVTCDSLGWTPGSVAQTCNSPNATKDGFLCALCDLPGPPAREPDCTSATALQNTTVLCVLSCSECS